MLSVARGNRMTDMPDGADVVVVGAGIAGSACAAMLAEGGREVLLVDRRSFATAGASWVNGVPAWAFVASGVLPPRPPERRDEGDAYILCGPSARPVVRVTVPDVWSVDMRLLGERLRARAWAAGVQGMERTVITGVQPLSGGGWRLETSRGWIRCRLIVDASGLRAAVRQLVWPTAAAVEPDDICSAAQAVFALADDQAASEFCQRLGLREGQVLGISGLAGGYSVLNVAIDRHAGEVSMLTGTIPAAGRHPSGQQLMQRFVASHPWIGPRVFGGAGAIPIRRPFSRLVSPGFALLGDAACQVFPAHGSGIGIGLCAARLLADAVLAVPADRIGDLETLWTYAATFHRRYGGVLAGYDLVRRVVQGFDAAASERLLVSGLLTPASVAAGLRQVWPSIEPARLATLPLAVARAPGEAWMLAQALRRMPLVRRQAEQYPLAPDRQALQRYEARMSRLMGSAAEVAA
jgi:flavin-dependent dehydrogenase